MSEGGLLLRLECSPQQRGPHDGGRLERVSQAATAATVAASAILEREQQPNVHRLRRSADDSALGHRAPSQDAQGRRLPPREPSFRWRCHRPASRRGQDADAASAQAAAGGCAGPGRRRTIGRRRGGQGEGCGAKGRE
eukprot:1250370-Prymnesium_polylepis.1